MEADFSGYATKAGLKCSDGRTIMPEAFKHDAGNKVPLVWQHGHNDVTNVLGHAVLEDRPDGTYAYGFFNDTPHGQAAKMLVEHGDIKNLSIFANNLVERSKQVFHGVIREVSLVLSGANPGAKIDYVRVVHSDGSEDVLADEAVIYTGLPLEYNADENLEHADAGKSVSEVYDTLTAEQQDVVAFLIAAAVDDATSSVSHSSTSATLALDENATVKDVYDAMTEQEQAVVNFMIGSALEAAQENAAAQHSDIPNQEGNTEMANVFESANPSKTRKTLAHSDLEQIVNSAKSNNGSLREAFTDFLQHDATYGIEDIDYLFPDAKTVTSQPNLISRRTEWVRGVLDGAKHSPFARIKSLAADLTADEARAKGYVKATLKKEEVIRLLKRVTTPTTVYKKQKLDRDDVVDITDLDVISWLKWEMRFMLEEELARAILVGDGREPDDDDKIDEDKLRPIAFDDEMYAHQVLVNSNLNPEGIVEAILRTRKHYKGTGTPTFYTTDDILTDMLLIKDKMGRRVYNNVADLAGVLRVDDIVVVEVMEDVADLLGILVNMADYTIGADKGGEVSMFDDFDIDYNQMKYLIETRISGALTKPKSAVVIKRVSGTTVTPTTPTYNPTTHVLVVPTVTGVTYYDVTNPLSAVVLTAGNKTLTATIDVEARPNTNYNFPHNIDADWTYVYVA